MMSILFFGAGLTTCTNNLDALLASRTLVWYWALDKCASAGWQWARAAVLFWHWCNCVEMAVCPTSCYLFNANGNITPLAISSQLPPCYLPNWHRFLFSTQGSSLFACMIAKEVLFWETDWSRKEKKKRILSIAVWPNDVDFCLYICSVFHIFVCFKTFLIFFSGQHSNILNRICWSKAKLSAAKSQYHCMNYLEEWVIPSCCLGNRSFGSCPVSSPLVNYRAGLGKSSTMRLAE